MVLLDYIAEKRGMSIPREADPDPDLWAQPRSAASAAGVGSLFRLACVQIINDTPPISERGVPAIDVIDFDYSQRDSLADNLTAVSARSLNAVGEAVYG